jgi:OCT family organic cation transporter-like MFS transporter 4/5
LIGKTGASGAFASIYVFSAELYPTTVRNAGIGASSCAARIGAMAAPYIADIVSTDCRDFYVDLNV